jgi:hypothetical protein
MYNLTISIVWLRSYAYPEYIKVNSEKQKES